MGICNCPLVMKIRNVKENQLIVILVYIQVILEI